MEIRKVLGGFAWVILAVMLIMVNAAAGSSDSVSQQTDRVDAVSSVMQ